MNDHSPQRMGSSWRSEVESPIETIQIPIEAIEDKARYALRMTKVPSVNKTISEILDEGAKKFGPEPDIADTFEAYLKAHVYDLTAKDMFDTKKNLAYAEEDLFRTIQAALGADQNTMFDLGAAARVELSRNLKKAVDDAVKDIIPQTVGRGGGS